MFFSTLKLAFSIFQRALAQAATVVERPKADPEQLQNLCADAGYKGEGALQAAAVRDYQPHIKQRKEEAEAKRTQPGWKARR